MPSDNNLKAKTAMSTILLIIVAICAMSCKECPTEQPDYDIYLSAEDVFSTSVVLNVTLPDFGDVSAFALDRNDSTVATYTCYDDDTLIIDEGLTPDTDYIYRVRFLKDCKTKAESEPVTVHTMPTTSHEFTWEIDTLGNYGSYLNDVWIVDENNIWAVGYLRVDDPDSSFDGTGQETFNAAHWDGEKWNLMRTWGPVSLNSIWYFSVNDIWVSSGFPEHWDGNQWTMYHLQNMGLGTNVSTEYIWASSPDDIYFVGYKGSIVHYDGSTFTKMESGTNIDLTDIWGYDQNHIWACGEDMSSMKSIILRFDGSDWHTIYERYDPDGTNNLTDEHPGSPAAYTLWMYPNSSIIWFDGGTDTYQMSQELYPTKYIDLDIFSYFSMIGFPRRIRGNSDNDVFTVGDHEALHWNGQTWHRFSEIITPARRFKGLSIKDDFVVMAGNERQGMFDVGLVVRGHRN